MLVFYEYYLLPNIHILLQINHHLKILDIFGMYLLPCSLNNFLLPIYHRILIRIENHQ
nr:MAG TPA: hypothetical protein [Caudoviricetes sp.]